MKIIASLLAIILLSTLMACAKSTADLSPQYVSPAQYSHYSCQQIEREMQSISSHITDIGSQVNKQHEKDKVKMGVGLILFFPTLFFMDGDTPQAAEYARLKGEANALEKASIEKNCHIRIERAQPMEAEKTNNKSSKNR